MLKLSILELLLGAIPEQFIFVIGVYVLSSTIFDKKKIFITSIISGIIVFFIRLLPIYMGIHIFLFFMILTLLLVLVNKISVSRAISSLLILVIARLVTEAINVSILTNLFNISPESFVNDRFLKLLYWTPSTLLFGLIVYVVCKMKYNPVQGEE